MSFANWVKQKRLAKGYSLRAFCLQIEEDPSNWSKVERELASPPQNKIKLDQISLVLDLSAVEQNELMDLAKISAGNLPDYVMNDKELLDVLPVFFRTIENVKPTREELIQFVEQLKNA